ncbi:LytTR family transcriptional regulator [Mucilaginibacter sp. BJC16-A38]|uniref:LytR/AlgR family response regulator transcription factor n=1 Tax=Mucilaginibacter phenanthrenivorans TaxID=1234842 RepID=UPI0021573D5A|nr:LytTR family DNA-binding domain-containing protein [Mucilaginibacter phenanthrenivorans]MCR8557295.1 LytTR family transcriptional regulator [Mucilaginibacter phenanthrenivorans]
MYNHLKNSAIIDLQGPGFGHDMIFVKDHLLYLPGNNLIGSKEIKLAETLLMNSFLPKEIPGVLTYKPSIWDAENTLKEEQPVKTTGTKTSFLVFKNQKYTTVQTENIAFFYIRNEAVSMMCFDQQEYTLNQSLDQITSSVSSGQFFRVNRKYLINFKAIKEVEHYFLRKLFVKLLIDTPDKLLIHKEKTNAFLSWMGDR